MSVAPNHSEGIVTLSLHVGWIDVFWHFLDLEDLSAVDLIDATSALTLNAKVMWVDSLFECYFPLRGSLRAFVQMLLDQNFAFDRIVSSFQPLQ